MTWKLYHIPPMDAGWALWGPVEPARSDILFQEVCFQDAETYDKELREFDAAFDAAKTEARRLGWRGDFAVEPQVFWLPGDISPIYGFAWKAEDNGSTYVASPMPLSHLARVCLEEATFSPFGPPLAVRREGLADTGPRLESEEELSYYEEIIRGMAITKFTPFERLYAGNKFSAPPGRRTRPTPQGELDLALIARSIMDPATSDRSLLFLLSLRLHVVANGELTPAQRACINIEAA